MTANKTKGVRKLPLMIVIIQTRMWRCAAVVEDLILIAVWFFLSCVRELEIPIIISIIIQLERHLFVNMYSTRRCLPA